MRCYWCGQKIEKINGEWVHVGNKELPLICECGQPLADGYCCQCGKQYDYESHNPLPDEEN